MVKNESVIYFTFVVVCYYLNFFKNASLRSLIKLVNILRKYAASELQHFKKD